MNWRFSRPLQFEEFWAAEMPSINVVIVLIMLITSAHAGEQIDTAPIEEPPLPRPRPSLHEVTRRQSGGADLCISSSKR